VFAMKRKVMLLAIWTVAITAVPVLGTVDPVVRPFIFKSEPVTPTLNQIEVIANPQRLDDNIVHVGACHEGSCSACKSRNVGSDSQRRVGFWGRGPIRRGLARLFCRR